MHKNEDSNISIKNKEYISQFFQLLIWFLNYNFERIKSQKQVIITLFAIAFAMPIGFLTKTNGTDFLNSSSSILPYIFLILLCLIWLYGFFLIVNVYKRSYLHINKEDKISNFIHIALSAIEEDQLEKSLDHINEVFDYFDEISKEMTKSFRNIQIVLYMYFISAVLFVLYIKCSN